MKYTDPGESITVNKIRIQKNLLLIIIGTIVAIAAITAVAFSFLSDKEPLPASTNNPAPVTSTIEKATLYGTITHLTPTGFTLKPFEGGAVVATEVAVTLTPETVYEKRSGRMSEEDYQKEFADYQATVKLASQGDVTAIEYLKTHNLPDGYTYAVIQDLRNDLRFAVGDTVMLVSSTSIAHDATEVVPVRVRYENVTTYPDITPQYIDDEAESPVSSATLVPNPLAQYTLFDLVSEYLGIPVAQAAACPYSPPNGGGWVAGLQRYFSYDFSAGQYLTGFHIKPNCDDYSSDDGCIDIKVDALGGSDMFYQPNGGSWTGFSTFSTVDLGPGQYISGIQFRTNCDGVSSEDGCINVKIASAAPGTSAYRTNAGSWTGFTSTAYYSDNYYDVPAGSYISGIDFRANCDFYSSEDDCVRFKISSFTTDDALCAPPTNTLPRGNNDTASCTQVAGWAQDPDGGNPLAVHFYRDGTYATGVLVGGATANQYRADLCGAIGSCNHGYTFNLPASAQTEGNHTITAYAIDSTGGPNPSLGTLNYSCAPVAPPVCVANAGTWCGQSAPNSCGMRTDAYYACDGSCPIPAAPSNASCPVVPNNSYLRVSTSPSGPFTSSFSGVLGTRLYFQYYCEGSPAAPASVEIKDSDNAAHLWTGSVGGDLAPASGVVSSRLRLLGSHTQQLTCYNTPTGTVSPAGAAVSVNFTAPPEPLLEVQVNGGAWSTSNQTVQSTDTVRVRWNANYDYYRDYRTVSPYTELCTGVGFNNGGVNTNMTGTNVSLPAAGSSVDVRLDCIERSRYNGGEITHQDSSNAVRITVNALPPANLTAPNVTHTLGTFNSTTNTYDSVTVRFTTRNDGGLSTVVNPTYRMRFDKGDDGSYDETQTGSIGVLAAGAVSGTLSQTFTNVPFGRNIVEVAADEPSQVVESNEGDNVNIYNFGGMLPPPDPGLSITADRTRVKAGETVTLSWTTTLTYAMNCRVYGPGMDVNPSGLSGTHTSSGINAKSEFVFACTEPITGAVFSDSVLIETVGEIQEI